MALSFSFQRTASVARKEVLHLLRDRQTLFMTMFFPIVELFMLGYAIDTNVRNIRTVVLDEAQTQESRALLQRFENSNAFMIVGKVYSEPELHEAMVAGRASVGIRIPQHYSRRLEANDTAEVQILVDGTVSSVAGEALAGSNGLALSESLERTLGDRQLPVDARQRILFNPDTRSANFFIPGLIVVLCQIMAVSLSANAIVREKENGTLEQLFMTPVRPGELIIGKMTPYLALTFIELCTIALLMRTIFAVPIKGQFVTLTVLAFPFVLTMLALGLWVSTRVSTRDGAMQMSMATIVPCVFLSGYVFPLDSMPQGFKYMAYSLPTTWLIDASRRVILCGAGWKELWLHGAVLTAMAAGALVISTLRFRKQLS
jgi:ABC-2 type transport system permease protein